MEPIDYTETAPLLQAQPSRLLSQVATTVTRQTGQALEAMGAHRNHFAVLATLEAFGPQSQANLSRRTHIDRSDMVAALERLERDGSVSRSVDPQDRRQNVVSLTASGGIRLTELSVALDAAQRTAFAGIDAVELDQLVAILGKLRSAGQR